MSKTQIYRYTSISVAHGCSRTSCIPRWYNHRVAPLYAM